MINMEIGYVYKGNERRSSHRRITKNRRDMIRFEPDKADRRSGKDRRSAHNTWQYSS